MIYYSRKRFSYLESRFGKKFNIKKLRGLSMSLFLQAAPEFT